MKIPKWIKNLFFEDEELLTKQWESEFKEASRLTPEQITHNGLLDIRINQAKIRNKAREDSNNRKIAAWEKHREENPDEFFLSCPDLDMTSPERVCGIRYVE